VRISVIGCGYLGAVHASAMAALGHTVVGIDVDEAKVAALAQGRTTFYEPGLPELLTQAAATGRLRFNTAVSAAAGARVHFIAVGTPQAPDGSALLDYVDAAVDALLPQLAPGDLVVGKSTVPVGTAERLAPRIEARGAHLAWNPEFLREGFAVRDTLEPDRIVYGVRPGDDTATQLLDEVYATALGTGTPRIVTDYATAELVKVSANAFLATKISFINAMAEIAEVVGADVTQLADAIGHDARIGRRFLNAGVGFGGGCLPKDIRGFIARAEELGAGESLGFLREVDQINMRRRARVIDLAVEALGGDATGRRIAVLGLAFKPDSDDVRDSPALDVAGLLHAQGARVRATDPQAIETSRRVRPDLEYVGTADEALDGAELVIVLTEWREFRDLDPVAVARLVARPVIIDGRNCLPMREWQEAGWDYTALGRGSLSRPVGSTAGAVSA
jgi:UDPglucose 6-dehydrogenase